MVDQSTRGGKKAGAGKGEQKKHQGVKPGSTTQKKDQRQKRAEQLAEKGKNP